MTPERLHDLAASIYGPKGWIYALAGDLDVQPATVWRWANGSVPIPGPARLAVECLAERAAKARADRPASERDR